MRVSYINSKLKLGEYSSAQVLKPVMLNPMVLTDK